ncbi:MAG: hypothetical protein HZA50_12180, partial [Planctomycetes bacterium]|nr:hypothetical protein [Planctomycetota bacterium]MBI5724711.1 hypothetical protein [Planctomycetota bacterium]
QVILDRIAILSYDVGTLTSYSRSDEIPKNVKDALTKAIDLKVEMERLAAKINEMERQVQVITNGEERIRKNIDTFGKDSPQGQEQMKKLAESEKKIDDLNAGIAEHRLQLDKKRKELEDYVRDLKID